MIILTSDEICRLLRRRVCVKRDSKRWVANLNAHEYKYQLGFARDIYYSVADSVASITSSASSTFIGNFSLATLYL